MPQKPFSERSCTALFVPDEELRRGPQRHSDETNGDAGCEGGEELGHRAARVPCTHVFCYQRGFVTPAQAPLRP